MLGVVINPDAEKIARGTIRSAGMKMTLLAGASKAASGPPKPKIARTGSVEAKAMEHPMVQEAMRLFEAEIQTVMDLRGDD